MQRDGLGGGAFDILLHVAVSGVERVGLGRESQINDRLRQRQIAFRHADEIHGIARGHAERKRIRFGQADVFDRHADDTPRNVEGIFASFEHSPQPVK